MNEAIKRIEKYVSGETLNLCGLGLTEIPNHHKLSQVTSLHCVSNQLQNLPDNLTNLQYLWCFNNQLQNLPDNLTNLKELYCYNNQLQNLPDNLSCFHSS